MKIDQFADRLHEALDTNQAQSLLNEYLKSYSIYSYAFTYYSGHVKTGQKLQFHCVSAALKPWHIHYLEQNYADCDRTLEQNHHMMLPLLWSVQDQLAKAKNNREKLIRLESIEFGINKGLSIPLHGPQNDFATLALHQRKNETCLVDYKKHQYEWMSAGFIFYHTIKRILNNTLPALDESLTKREKQCLTLTAQSRRVEDIARELKISPRTVNFHIQNANKKLGTNNKYQSMIKYFNLETV